MSENLICTYLNEKATLAILQDYAVTKFLLSYLERLHHQSFIHGSNFIPRVFCSFSTWLCMQAAGALNLPPGEVEGKVVNALLC